LAAARRLLFVAIMPTMSIRRKLFLAFALVAAISSTALLLLAQSYVRTVRAELDARFLEQARSGFDRQTQLTELIENQVLDMVSNGALDPKMVASMLKDEASWRVLGDRMPVLVQLALYDGHHQVGVWAWGRPGVAFVDPLRDPVVPSLLEERQAASGDTYFGGQQALVKDGRSFAIASSGRAAVVAELDPHQLFRSLALGENGRAVLLDYKTGAPLLATEEVERVRSALPGLNRLIAQRPSNGGIADLDDGRGRRYRVYSAVSAETSREAIMSGASAIAVMPLDELYAPLARIRLRVVLSVAGTILLALVAAMLLSGRFVQDIERIRAAVAAFAQGDWKRLHKTSRDELGGALVDSINDMTTAVAERMRRDEAESWRSLVRVVSHEINNTLAPIRSVASSLRCGLEKRLRDGDAGADVEMALKLIVERVDALATFIDGYAEVAKLPHPERRLTDVEQLVKGATTLFAEDAEKRGVALEVRATDVGAAEIDAQQIERVIVNLVKNALEASPRGSAVDVMAGRIAGGLEIVVADAGPGISPEARRNLFVPYFTTKAGGSGIGLALARQIVVAHGGTITAERSPSGGTLMRVLVPDVAHDHPYREVG
jgi:signal transduction histidine kinase